MTLALFDIVKHSPRTIADRPDVAREWGQTPRV